ncbi:MAG: ABC transporter permease [Clostridia bacterium]|nr:ABC transporter permease [Clostridia bacterium]
MSSLKKILRSSIKAGIISWLVAVAIWQIASLLSKPEYLPGPIQTILGVRELLEDGSLARYILVSFGRVISGWILGNLIAIPLGLLIGRIRIIKELIEPFIDFFRFVPAIAFITLFIMWFGIGEQSKVILIMYATSFIVMINTAAGVLALDENKVRAARSLGATELQILFHVVIPAAVPYIFTGIRLAMGNSFMAIVGAEMIAAKEGVGYLIWTARLYFKTDWVFVGLFSLGFMGFLTDRILREVGARTMRRYGIKNETRFGGG